MFSLFHPSFIHCARSSLSSSTVLGRLSVFFCPLLRLPSITPLKMVLIGRLLIFMCPYHFSLRLRTSSIAGIRPVIQHSVTDILLHCQLITRHVMARYVCWMAGNCTINITHVCTYSQEYRLPCIPGVILINTHELYPGICRSYPIQRVHKAFG